MRVDNVNNSGQLGQLFTERNEIQGVASVINEKSGKEVRQYFFKDCKRLKYPSSPRNYLVELYKNLLETLLSLLPTRTTDNSIVNDYPDLPNVIYSDECRDIFLGLVHAHTLINRTHRVMEGHRYMSIHEDVSGVLQLMFPLLELCKVSIEDSWDGYVLGIIKELFQGEFTARELWLETGIDRKKLQKSLHRLHLSGHLERQGSRYRGYVYACVNK